MSSLSSTYVCPSCQASHEQPSNFCGQCGAKLDVGSQSAVSPGIQSSAFSITIEQGTEEGGLSGPKYGRRSSDMAGSLWLGRLIDDRYRVIDVLGKGGMGVVYKVEHQRMGKIAAMKVLHDELASDIEIIERFHREAEAVSRLTHPNTVQVFDFGVAHSARYLVMEYVRGVELAVLVERDGPLPFERAAPLLAQIGGSLGEAHELGIVHRDLKPENVLVTRTQRGRDFIKVLDFGLAKLSNPSKTLDPKVTDKGLIVGTPYYMSPEQIRGEDIDARADIYSFGSLMYQVLTGVPAFTSKTPMGVLTKHLTEALVPPSKRVPGLNIHPRIDEIVLRAMAKKPDERYQNISEIMDAIESAYAELGEGVSSLGMPALSGPVSTGRMRAPHSTSLSLADVVQDSIDYGIDSSVRLQRADLDQYERSLRRQHLVLIALVPLIIVALAGVAAYFLVLRPPPLYRADKEPNNDLDSATRVAPDTEITGYLGKRIAKLEPDRDFYRVVAQPGDVMTVRLIALPNVDMELSLFDDAGTVLARVDEGGVGHSEYLHRLRVMGPVRILVTEAMPNGPRMPVENVSDVYTLTATLERGEEAEVEPNHTISEATRLRPDVAMRGHLDRRADLDLYRFEGAAGRYELVIEAPAELPLTWRAEGTEDTEEPSATRSAEVMLTPGVHIRLERSDRDRQAGTLLPAADAEYTLRVRPLAPQ